jgi:hypothetical protein
VLRFVQRAPSVLRALSVLRVCRSALGVASRCGARFGLCDRLSVLRSAVEPCATTLLGVPRIAHARVNGAGGQCFAARGSVCFALRWRSAEGAMVGLW